MGNFWLILIVLGGLMYYVVRHSTSGLTRTPVWALWLVLMLPAFTWALWEALAEEEATMPQWLLLSPVAISPFLYFWLLQRGRRPETGAKATADPETAPQESLPQLQQPPRLLSPEEEANLRGCFPWNTYYLQQVAYGLQTVNCLGKLRSDPATAYERVRTNIEERFGSRFLVVFQERPRGEAYFSLYPNPYPQQPESPTTEVRQAGLALLLLAITFFTTAQAGAQLSGESIAALQSDPSLLRQGLPYALGILWILGVHGFSYFIAASYHRIPVSLPLLIPIPFFLGVLGVFSQRRAPIPNRRALFDTALAGPLAGFLVALPVFVGGLSVSGIVPLETPIDGDMGPAAGLFNFGAFDPQGSLLLFALCKLALGEVPSPDSAIALSPLAIAGYVGLAIAAFKLVPVGRLDGGHVIHAMYGLHAAVLIGKVAQVLILLRALAEPSLLPGAIVIFLLPPLDRPALDDVTELNGWRDAIGLLVLALLASLLLPAPGFLLG